MIGDTLTVMRKEWQEIMAMGGAQRGRLQLLVFLGVTGVFLPLEMGTQWVTSPAVIAVWGWVPVMLVSTVIADCIAGERERHTLETLLASRLSDSAILAGKMAAAVAYGWGLSMGGLVLGLVTVNVANRGGGLLLYPPTTVVGALVLSFLGALLASAGGVLVSLRAQTVRQAQQTLSVATMAIFIVPLFGLRALPDELTQRMAAWAVQAGTPMLLLTGLAALAAIDLLLIIAARARFQRPKLAAD
jgi:ABC-2 type transport system permease protein